MELSSNKSQRSVAISKATFAILFVQIVVLWCSSRCMLDIGPGINITQLQPQSFNELSRSTDFNSGPFPSGIPADKRTKSRVLVGIMAVESRSLNDYARVHRELFALHPNVCSLQYFTETRSSACELLYTFVLGGNENGPTEIVNDTMPVLASSFSKIFSGEDVTHLNIRENMNEGKSQTWFYYASTVADELGIDYVGKIDLDTMLYLDKFFGFKEMHLPPAPCNNHILVGQMVDKDVWNVEKYGKRFVTDFWEKEKLVLEHLLPSYHIYAQGGCYIMSADLVKGVVRVANTVPKENYFEQQEDHDVTTMAFISTVIKEDPNYAATMSLKQMTSLSLFWKHPVKRQRRNWAVAWRNEYKRMERILRNTVS